MADAPYHRTVSADAYRGHDAPDPARAARSVGEHAFIWIAWALAAIFWGATMTAFIGIVRAVLQPSPGVGGGLDAGGVGFLLMDVVGGLLLLGAGLAYGSAMVARRNRGMDPAGEAATARLYDDIDRQGGEDMTSLSPEAERERR